MPIAAKKNGGKNAYSGPTSFSTAARSGDSAMTMPARNAPMMPARPISPATTASPMHSSTAGRIGESANRGAVSSPGCAAQQPAAAEGHEPDEGGGEARRDEDAPRVDGAVRGDADGDREHEDRQDVVDDRRAQDRASGPRAHGAELGEHGGRDADARRDERGGEEGRGRGVLPAQLAQREPGGSREHDAEHRDEQRDAPDRPQVREARLESDPEQQKDDAELGEHVEHRAEVHEPEHRRADEDAREDLADDGRLVDALEQLVPELRREQDDEDVGQCAGGVGGRGEREQQVRGHREEDYAARAAVPGADPPVSPAVTASTAAALGPVTQSVSRLRTCETVPTRAPEGSWIPIRAPT